LDSIISYKKVIDTGMLVLSRDINNLAFFVTDVIPLPTSDMWYILIE